MEQNPELLDPNQPVFSDEQIFLGNLRYRMYNLVLYNISPIQQGIQVAHSIVEYSTAFFNTIQYQRWAQVDKTIMVMNAGSTIKLKEKMDYLIDNQLTDLSFFKEVDLDNAITAVSFLVDERLWDKEKYPDGPPSSLIGSDGVVLSVMHTWNEAAYINSIGGEKNYLLKKFIDTLRFA